MTPTFTSCGKQVLRDGAHFADAVSQDAADLIVSALGDAEAAKWPRHEWANAVTHHQ